MVTVDRSVQSAIAEAAAKWFVLNRGGVLSVEERAAFGDWLKASPLHIEEYLKTAVMSRNLHAAIQAMDVDIDSLLRQARAEVQGNVVALGSQGNGGQGNGGELDFRARRRIRPNLIAAMAAAAVLALLGVVWMERDGQRFGLPKEFETVHGEQRSWLLPDGTGLELNSDSAVIVRYNSQERLLQMERGQALFHVAHESRRRFRVIAGDTGVIAVGTEFDVFRKSGSTLVTVVEGKVAVFTGAAPPPTLRATLPSQAIAVGAGEQVQVGADSRTARPRLVNVQQAVAWVQRQIAFDQRPLGEVAEEFNRYSAYPVVIRSARLRSLPISGVFSAYDTDSFVAFLSRLDGVAIERSADQILVFSDSSRPPVSQAPD